MNAGITVTRHFILWLAMCLVAAALAFGAQLAVAEGSRVRAGQVLATIDAAEVSARLAERQALVESARAAMAQAERTHNNNQRLADQQFISPTALEQSRAALDGWLQQFGDAPELQKLTQDVRNLRAKL